MKLTIPSIDYLALAPELSLIAGSLFLLFAAALMRQRLTRAQVTSVSVVAGLAALVSTFFQWHSVSVHGASVTAASAVAVDGFSVLASGVVALCVVGTAFVAHDWLTREGLRGTEFHILALAASSGAMIMAQANDLIVIFLGLEILSIGLYVLVGFDRHRSVSAEAALKYFLLGGFASAIFAYGAALTYGATGSTNLTVIANVLSTTYLVKSGILLAGVGLLAVGFAFKIAAVPFHQWSPDVYDGAPTPVTGLMAGIVKVGAFAAFLRVMLEAVGTSQSSWRPIVLVLVVLSCLVGAVAGLAQRNIKRLLAYSSINTAGFMLLGLWSGTPRGVSATLYYVAIYAPLTLATFAVATLVGGRGDTQHSLDAYRGLARRQPWLGGALTVLLLAQSGAPFTTGFFAKFSVLEAAIGSGGAVVAAVAMVSAAVVAFYYLRVILSIFADDVHDAVRIDVPRSTGAVIGVVAGASVVGGIWVGPLVDLAHRASLLFFS